jgi:hypothetical protein
MLRGPLHTTGPDGRCLECGEPFPWPTGLAIYGAVIPRQLPENPRCTCSSPDPRGRPPMFYALHPYGPCQATVDGQPCGCTATP